MKKGFICLPVRGRTQTGVHPCASVAKTGLPLSRFRLKVSGLHEKEQRQGEPRMNHKIACFPTRLRVKKRVLSSYHQSIPRI